jgi:hypothetical protein
MPKFKGLLLIIFCSTSLFGQDINFSSEYNKVLWPIALGLSGGITGDDGQYKRLALYHGGSISLQTGSNSPGIANSRLFIDNTGKVGIGTISPAGKLHVFSSGGLNNGIVVESNTSGNYSSTDYKNNSSDLLQVGVTGSSFVNGLFVSRQAFLSTGAPNGLVIGAWDANGYLSFGTGGGAAGNERMRILSNGNIGIGTISPNSKLVIADGGNAISFNPGGIGFNRNVLDGQIFNLANSAWQFSSRDDRFTLEGYNGPPNSLFTVLKSGFVGIGTNSPDAKLAVKGQVHAQEVKVDLNGAVAPDYVFEPTYHLSPLDSIKTYIDKNKHLPEVPSAKEMEKNGVNLGEMNMLLLKKIEELTLYVIELKKNDQERKEQVRLLSSEVEQLKTKK